jgi:uncharacterized protein (TIGR02646 family)
MRFVDPVEVELALPEDWNETVRKAEEFVKRAVEREVKRAIQEGKQGKELEEVEVKARAKAISAKSAVWSHAGAYVGKVMQNKCWYCETRETRSDMPVDHFRPKNSVSETQGEHTGYWWLAFQWRNFRYSCTFCNSRRKSESSEGGKQDLFPLLDPESRAWTPQDPISNESPLLLDPCNPEDPNLLCFDEQGRAVANPGLIGEELRRVNESIKIYHLNHDNVKKSRRLIAIKIRNQMERIKELDQKSMLTTLSPNEIEQKKDALTEIIRHVRSSAEFCTSARCYIAGFRHLKWVEHFIERHF